MASSSSTPGPPTDSSPSLFSAIKLAFQCTSTALSRLKAALLLGTSTMVAPHSPTIPRQTLPNIHPGSSVIIPMPDSTASHHIYMVPPATYQHSLPLYVCVQQHRPRTPSLVGVGKLFMSITFQAAIGFTALSFQSSSSSERNLPLLRLHVVEIAIVIGFATSLIGIILHHAYPVVASIFEKIGSLVGTIGFFLMVSTFLPTGLMWIGWFCGAAFLVAFIFSLIK